VVKALPYQAESVPKYRAILRNNQNRFCPAMKLLLGGAIQLSFHSVCYPIPFIKASFFAALQAVPLVAAGLPAAQAQVPRPATSQPVERARICQGVCSGELTPWQMRARLRAREANITAAKQAAQADGVIIPAEHRVVRGEERCTSRAIYRQKHDSQVQ
jgi:hypothetical protein